MFGQSANQILKHYLIIGYLCFSVFSTLVMQILFLRAGNGLFLFQMAKSCESSNFLGLEMNEKVITTF